MLTLYYAPGSSSMASHIALEEADARYHAEFINEDAGEQNTERFRKINPRGKVPALKLDDGSIISENVAIQTYIARTHPSAGLLPSEPADEARALSLMCFFASSVHVAFSHFYRPGRYSDDISAHEGIRSKGRQTFFGFCRDIDALLASKQWLLGQFSTVDAYAFVFYTWGLRLTDLPMHELPNYTAHKNRMLTRPAVQRILKREGVTIG